MSISVITGWGLLLLFAAACCYCLPCDFFLLVAKPSESTGRELAQRRRSLVFRYADTPMPRYPDSSRQVDGCYEVTACSIRSSGGRAVACSLKLGAFLALMPGQNLNLGTRPV